LITIALLAAAITTAVAIFVPWLPENRSEEGEWIDLVFWLTVGICIAVFAVVAAISVYSVAKFRVRPDDDSDGPPVHGHTGLEIAWTAVPTILVTVIAAVSAVALAENGKLKDDRLVVEVTARQFAWTFAYPPDDAAAKPKDEQLCQLPPEQPNCPVSGTLRLPAGRQVELRLRALDVIHSFWVPEFRQKQDAVPGIVTRVGVTPTEPGEHTVICTELCGLGHALMRAPTIVVPESEFNRWRSEQERSLQGGQG
jgi:cytochrome c oxidase subunit 2